jgi:hypothetical protein
MITFSPAIIKSGMALLHCNSVFFVMVPDCKPLLREYREKFYQSSKGKKLPHLRKKVVFLRWPVSQRLD